MNNPLRLLVEAIADHIHTTGDAEARAYGLTVNRLPWGRRSIHDPRIAVHLDQRRARALRDGLDDLDRALLDPATLHVLHDTADEQTKRRWAA